MQDFFQANDDACRLGLVCGQFCKARIAPIRETYYLTFLSFHPRNFEQFQYMQAPGVEKEGMLAVQLVKFCDYRMILSKHLRLKLRESLGYLGFVQLHGLFPIFCTGARHLFATCQ